MLRAGDEVVEAVLLGGEPPGVVPLLAELTAAADVCHHVDAALLQPQQQLRFEPRHQRDAETAVRGQQCRRGSVPWGARCADHVEGDTCAVPRRRELAGHLVPGQVDGGPRPQCGRAGSLAAGCCPPGRRFGEGLPRPRDLVLPERRQTSGVERHGAHRRDVHSGQRPPPGVEDAHMLRPAVDVHNPDPVASHRQIFDGQLACRHDLLGVGDRGTFGHRQAEHLAVRGVLAGKQIQRVGAEHSLHALIGDVSNLPPLAVANLATEEDLPFTTITLLNPVHDPAAVG